MDIREKRLNLVQYYLLVGTGISLLAPMLINNIFVALLLVTSFFKLARHKYKLNVLAGLFTTLFLLASISLLYSCDVPNGLKKLEKWLSFIIFPIVFGTMTLTKKQFRNLLLSFAFATILMVLVALIIATYKSYVNGSILIFNKRNLVIENFFRYHRLSQNIKFHATYLSIYLAFSLFVLIYYSFWSRDLLPLKRNLKFFIILFGVLVLVLLDSFAIVFAFFSGLVLLMFFFWNIGKKNKYLLLVVFGICVGFVFFNKVRGKVDQSTFKFSYSDSPTSTRWNSLNVRLAKWQCALEVYMDNAPFGVGTGCNQSKLQQKYTEKGFILALNKNYTSHNMYLRFLTENGIASFFVFLTLLSYGFYRAYRRKKYFLFVLIWLLTISSITEEVLSINKGIVFFTFFILLANHNLKNLNGKL